MGGGGTQTYIHQLSSKQQTQTNHLIFILMSIHLFILSVLQQTSDLEITPSPTYSTCQRQEVHRNL